MVDLDYLNLALFCIHGTHDFQNLCSEDYSGGTTVRHIFSTQVHQDNSLIRIYIQANGFLKRMMRSLVGVLLESERQLKPVDELWRVMQLEQRDLNKYSVIPSKGLFLCHVDYDGVVDDNVFTSHKMFTSLC